MRPLEPATKLLIVLGTASLLAATGCGGSGFTLAHPMGHYTNASLKGSYVYEVHGAWPPNGSIEPYREAGVFTADGAGHITAGIDEFEGTMASGSSASLSGSFSGSYSINNDGTGSIFLGPTVLGNAFGTSGSQIGFGITLVSSSKVQLIEGDSFADGAGVAELQDSAAITTAPNGTFVFRVHQEITASSNQAPASQVGGFTLAGGAGSGAMDQNLGGAFTSPNVTWSFSAPGSFGTGTATLTDASTGNATGFFYYIVNSAKFDLLTSNPSSVGSGSAEAQTGAVSSGLSGNYAFGSRGDDTNYTQGLYGTVATVGAITTGGGTITGSEDSMQDGNLTSNGFPGTCSSTVSAGGVSGRVLVTNISGNPCSGTVAEVFWMVSPSRAFFLDNSTNTFDDGTADLQTAGSFSASVFTGQYALIMDGWDLSGVSFGISPQVLARVGTLQFDGSSKLTLSELANGSNSGAGAQNPGVLTGRYSVSSNGRATGTVSNGGTPPIDLVMYGVSNSKAYVLQSDLGFVTSGTLELQQ